MTFAIAFIGYFYTGKRERTGNEVHKLCFPQTEGVITENKTDLG